MHALILAAGRGERMRPLTDETPKPLLYVGKLRLIEHRIVALVAAQITDIVINHAYLGAQIVETLGNGQRYGANIIYSSESGNALETGGGILNALPFLDSDPFMVVNGDIWTDFDFARLPTQISTLAHLVLVDNPAHNLAGDFCLYDQRVSTTGNGCKGIPLTFSGIGVYRHELFQDCSPGCFPLAPILYNAVAKKAISGEYYAGEWTDIGTPQKLHALDIKLREKTQETDW